jgi:NAD(P)-dependent dehydrogenase (short-subunit alcohol dehydrogenase family)
VSFLAGRVAVVTGASRGIGLAVATALRREGARVVSAARSLVPARSETHVAIRCDVTDEGQVASLAEATRTAFGPPDLVVNAAGGFLLAPLERTSTADFEAQLAANLRGPFLVTRAFLQEMRARGSSRLITIGSVADHRAFPENAAYAASKYGLRGLHEVLREELKGSGVRCTLLSPGPTDTAMWDPVDPDRREGFTPRAKMLRPEDVAEAVVWIGSRPAHVDIEWIRLGPA